MKPFQAFVKKEFLHILRDVRTLTILIGMPIILIILFGFSITNEIKDARIAFLDKSHDYATLELKHKITASGYFIAGAELEHEKQIEPAFQKGDIKLVVVFENNFYEKLMKKGDVHVEIITDASEPNMASALSNYIASIIRDYNNDLNNNTPGSLGIRPEVRMLYNPGLEGAFMFVPGLITVILMLVSAMMTSITIAREKEMGTMEILLVSPLKPWLIILGKSLPYVALAFINAISILILGAVLFHMPLEGNLVLLLLEILLYIITSLSLGILISTLANSQQTALLISLMGLMLPTILLSGFIFPLESMPDILQWISTIIPAKWFIIIIRNIMLKGSGLAAVLIETGILVAFTALLLGLSIKKFKIRLA